ncbi:hypothetical protein AB0C21_43025 [Spirillospora sp. NPDC049024]
MAGAAGEAVLDRIAWIELSSVTLPLDAHDAEVHAAPRAPLNAGRAAGAGLEPA